MHALITVNTINEDEEPKIAFDAEMKQRQWTMIDKIPFAYSKTYPATLSAGEAETNAKADVEAAANEAEWEKLDYILMVSNHHLSINTTP